MSNEVKMAQVLKEWEDKMKQPAWLAMINLTAKEKFAKYQAYQRAGFDAKQALEMVIKEGQ